MAIEITPKKKIKIPIWSTILFGIAGVLLIISIVSYFYFEKSSKEMTKALEKTPQEAFLEEEIEKKEKELGLYREKINTFGILLSRHQNTKNIFDFLEKTCLPNVWFSESEFDYLEGVVIVSGHTDNFVTLGQQILILKAEPLLKNVDLSEIFLAEEGGVDFSLQLNFNPQIFE